MRAASARLTAACIFVTHTRTQLVNELGRLAEKNSRGLVPSAAYVARVLQELAVSGAEYAARIETQVALNLVLAEGQDYMSGDSVPESDMSSGTSSGLS